MLRISAPSRRNVQVYASINRADPDGAVAEGARRRRGASPRRQSTSRLTFRRVFLLGASFGLLVGFIAAAYIVGSSAKARAVNCAAVTGEAQLQCVTRETNSQIVATDDFAHYGVNDVWVESPVDGKGDCEDYVLTKARKLEALGWSAARMSMATFSYGGKTHAVLLIDDAYVLDSLSPWVGRWKDYSLKPEHSYPIAFARSLVRLKSLPVSRPAAVELASAR